MTTGNSFTRAGLVLAFLVSAGLISAAVDLNAKITETNKIESEFHTIVATTDTNASKLPAFIVVDDTICPSFAIATDTVLSVVNGYAIKAKKQGDSRFILRFAKCSSPKNYIAVYTQKFTAIAKATTLPPQNPPCATDSIALAAHPDQILCGQAAFSQFKTVVSCNPKAIPTPSCADTLHSIPAWRTMPCNWRQNSDSTVACTLSDTTKAPIKVPPAQFEKDRS